MKRRNITVVLPWLTLIVALGAPPSPAGDKGGSGKLVRQRLQKLGFEVGAVKPLEGEPAGDMYAVKIKGFTQKVETLSLERDLKPFSLRVHLKEGVLLVDRDGLQKHGFKLKGGKLAFGVQAAWMGKKGPPIAVGEGKSSTPSNNPGFEAIRATLTEAQGLQAKALEMTGKIKGKTQEARAMLDGCKAPSAKGGKGILGVELLPMEPLQGGSVSNDPCSYNVEDAKAEKSYCKAMVGHVKTLLKMTTKTVKKIEARCKSKGISEEDKAGLRNDLGGLADAADSAMTHMNESIARINQLLAAQESCIPF